MIVNIQVNVESASEITHQEVAEALGITPDGEIFLVEHGDGTIEVSYNNSWLIPSWEPR